MSKEMNWPSAKMMLVTGNWGPVKTFKMIPIDKDAPFIECIFNPTLKILALIGTHKKDQFHMVERLNEDGEPQLKKNPKNEEDKYKKQRVSTETFSEYYLSEKEEIKLFIKNMAVNESEFNYEEYLNAAAMDAPSKSGIDTPPIILEP